MTTITLNNTDNVIVNDAALALDANSVVLNDIPAKFLTSNISAYSEITTLAAERNNWELNAYRTSNDQLYALLQRCYSLYVQMCVDSRTAKQLKNDVDKYLKDELGVKPLDSTHTIAKIVKCVFGADRRRVSAYSIALRAALAAKTSVADIPKFIRDSGGVEELRLAKSPNAKSMKDKAQAAAQTVDQHVIANLTFPMPAEKVDLAKIGSQHVLIVTQRADGTFDLNAVISATSAVNAALAAFYSQIKSEADATEVQQKQTRDDNALTQRINDAAQPTLQ